jgi:hypothetical protein
MGIKNIGTPIVYNSVYIAWRINKTQCQQFNLYAACDFTLLFQLLSRSRSLSHQINTHLQSSRPPMLVTNKFWPCELLIRTLYRPADGFIGIGEIPDKCVAQ